jgi:hypothetical protein
MKIIHFIAVQLIFVFSVHSQTFTGGTGLILDNQTINIPLSVSGIGVLDTLNFGLETVCINATHTWDGDVSFKIVAPDGTEAPLFSNIGGDGDNFTNTCLNQDAASDVVSSTPPFTGTFKPSGQMGSVNNGQMGSGTWYLRVTDSYGGDEGIVTSFSLTFGNNPATYFAFTSSLLPIIQINTNGNIIANEPKVMADMKITYNGEGIRNYLSDPVNHYNGKIGIEYRGNYSLSLPQKPFAFETWNATGLPVDTSILGMPSENDWLLLANYNDKSFARNVLPFHLFDSLGNYATRTRLVDVVLDGQYQGIYLLCEKIKRDKNRVDVSRLDTIDVAGTELTGGYMLKIDYWDNTNSWESNFSPIGFPGVDVHFVHVYPDLVEMQPEQIDYIRDYMNNFETALYSPNFTDPNLGYRAFIGVNSFIDYFIINEVARNGDGYKKSRYFYKDKNKPDGTVRKLKAGPVWDFDWAEKDMWDGSEDGSGFMYPNCDQDVNAPGWYIRLLEDTLFANEVRCKYDDYRRSILSEEYIHTKIDSVANLVNESQAWHYKIWGHMGVQTGTPEIGTPSQTYAEEVQKLKDWYTRRLNWLDLNMPGTLNGCSFSGLQEMANVYQLNAFPIPFQDALTIEWSRGQLTGALAELTDQQGRLICSSQISDDTENQFTMNGLEDLKAGCYFLRLTRGAEQVCLKVMK